MPGGRGDLRGSTCPLEKAGTCLPAKPMSRASLPAAGSVMRTRLLRAPGP